MSTDEAMRERLEASNLGSAADEAWNAYLAFAGSLPPGRQHEAGHLAKVLVDATAAAMREEWGRAQAALAIDEQEKQALRAEVAALKSQCEVLRQDACIAAELKVAALSPVAHEPSKQEDK